MERTISCKVTAEDSGKTVNFILKSRLLASGACVRSAKTHERGILRNGVRTYTRAEVCEGDLIELLVETGEKVSETIEAVRGALDIVYEDDDFLILNKSAGIPVHPSQGHFADSLANFVAFYMRERGNNFVFRAINRLDMNTSGVMAVAKSAHIHARMMKQLHTSEFYREYHAIICGVPKALQGTICEPIDREGELSLRRVVREGGDEATTHYEIQAQFTHECEKYSHAKVWLETGRTHQIRVHFAHIGCPVAGDFLYGTELDELPHGHALHSCLLRFTHPITGQVMEFSAQMPIEMQEFMKND